jgi:catecholate siderophore receptor
MRHIAFRTFLVVALSAPTMVLAQDPSPPKPDSAPPAVTATDSSAATVRTPSARDSSTHTLARVVVTAARRRAYTARNSTTAMKTDTPLRDTPQSVTVVTRALIADQGMQSMSDVARYVPGVTMAQGEGHRDAPVMRGNASTADFFVDGVRDDVQYLRDLYNAERIEVLKGPNAMIFGRGGGGGVINRVTKEAGWVPVRALTAEGGSFDHRRASLDVGQGFGSAVAARLNGMFERSALFRDATSLERFGINPTATFAMGQRSMARLAYELFDDRRVVDRGIPSFDGHPVRTGVSTFFGDPDASHARARVHAAALSAEHIAPSGLTLRNKARFAHYDKFYQNVYAAGTTTDGSSVNLAGYNNATRRMNLFNQTDVTYATSGVVRHTLLVGTELGRQATDNFRETGYFGGSATTYVVPLGAPTAVTPVAFRQSATDADNHVTALVGAVYAQDQIELGSHWQAIAGVRYDRFDLRYQNNRNVQQLRRIDRMLSPRVGVVYKPVAPASLYASFGVSSLPSSGDQFSSLNATTSTLKPERFSNYEIGAKWDVNDRLALTSAAYRLDRTNTSAKDPNDPARTVQTGAQRTSGYELGISGSVTDAWQLSGGWTTQRATIMSATSAARAGATVPLVPGHTLSFWNRYQALDALGVGVGVVHQARVFTAIDNSVTLPAFTRADAALFLALGRFARAQLNVENVFGVRYFATAQGNNNIMPGAPRLVRLALTTDF